ncbi:MAG: response regulator [Planctomycetaceae bacterium]|jgi:signal transduction histidine kinase/DNA-binding response OmpR family regulator|nr:response regulator [Planctomycetaceae bacterium]
MSADLQAEIDSLKKENAMLSRKLMRLQTTLERNVSAAVSAASINAMQAAEKRRQEHFMKLLLDTSPNVIFLLDKNGNIAYCTQKTLILAGIPNFAMINGKHYREVFYYFADTEDVTVLETQINRAAETGELLQREISLTQLDGDVRQYTLQFVSQRGAEKDFEGSTIAMYDITDIRQMQENAEKARQEAVEATKAKSVFLSNMSHEIRTPMNAIIGMTVIAQGSDEILKKDYCLSKIKEASNHLLGVINDILDISKIEANKFELSYHDISLEKLLQKVISIINFKAEDREQKLTLHTDKNVPAMIESDELRLSQVLTNLLSNAVKFTPEHGTIELDVKLLDETDGVCTLRFEISDTGIGLSPEQQSRLFQSFEQADKSTSRKFGGTGLGLAISKRIVEMMGGIITVESELGKGSTFQFTVKTNRRSVKNVRLLRPDLTLGNMRILVVDDLPESLEYFSNVASSLKIQCDTALSAAAAYDLIEKRGAYDMYFLDWRMPNIDGVELTRKIKERNNEYSVIVMISAEDFDSIERVAREAGVDNFLRKPLYPSSIVNCLNHYAGFGDNVDQKHLAFENIFAGKFILVAEDVRINREIVKAQLAVTQVSMDFAVDGRDAVEQFKKEPNKYSMIFMDMQMPELDGVEATQAIRTLEGEMINAGIRTAPIPIVAMTANVFKEDIEKCIEAGMNDHVGKPLDISVVIEKMKKYIA